jgi:hypothetical protein
MTWSLEYEKSFGVPFPRLNSLQLIGSLLYKPFSNGTRRYVIGMRRKGD